MSTGAVRSPHLDAPEMEGRRPEKCSAWNPALQMGVILGHIFLPLERKFGYWVPALVAFVFFVYKRLVLGGRLISLFAPLMLAQKKKTKATSVGSDDPVLLERGWHGILQVRNPKHNKNIILHLCQPVAILCGLPRVMRLGM